MPQVEYYLNRSSYHPESVYGGFQTLNPLSLRVWGYDMFAHLSTTPDWRGTFVARIIYFEDLHRITSSVTYSSMIYGDTIEKGTNRRSANLKEIGSLIIFDIDQGMKLANAKETLRGYKSLIVTTKSHQIQKGDKGACDRFRALIPLYMSGDLSLPIPPNEYKKFYTYVANFLGLHSFDTACTDTARFYYPNSSQEVWYSESDEVLEFEVLYEGFKLSQAHNHPTFIAHIPASYDQVFETHNGMMIGWNDAKSKPTPVHCILPDHPDENASAFIALNEAGKPFFHCKGCGVTKFMGISPEAMFGGVA